MKTNLKSIFYSDKEKVPWELKKSALDNYIEVHIKSIAINDIIKSYIIALIDKAKKIYPNWYDLKINPKDISIQEKNKEKTTHFT
jgi:hypothetical protein